MIYFDSRYLSSALNVNSAKWKRWAREFLPVDPLGGYQSGYARQFSYKDAFRVYLGGKLVGELKFTIPEARQILGGLDPWLKLHGFYAVPQDRRPPAPGAEYIYVYHLPHGKFAFAVRTIIAIQQKQDGVHIEKYMLTTIGARTDLFVEAKIPHARVIHIRQIHRSFLGAVNGQKESV